MTEPISLHMTERISLHMTERISLHMTERLSFQITGHMADENLILEFGILNFEFQASQKICPTTLH